MQILHLTYEPSFDDTARVYVHPIIETELPDGTTEIDPNFDEIVDRFDFTIDENDTIIDTYDTSNYIDEFDLWPSSADNQASWIAHYAAIVPRFEAWLKSLADTPIK